MTLKNFSVKRNLCHMKLAAISASLRILLSLGCLTTGESAQLSKLKENFEVIAANFKSRSSRKLAEFICVSKERS